MVSLKRMAPFSSTCTFLDEQQEHAPNVVKLDQIHFSSMSDTMPLRPYQIEDVLFLSKLDCAACFNEQRTGKTPTIINVLIQKRLRKALIICPASALYQWQEEHMRWTQRPCVVIAGTPKQKQKPLRIGHMAQSSATIVLK